MLMFLQQHLRVFVFFLNRYPRTIFFSLSLLRRTAEAKWRRDGGGQSRRAVAKRRPQPT